MSVVSNINNVRTCKKCKKLDVSWKGNWETCSSCGEVYRKREVPVEELQDIIIKEENSKGRYFNKALFFFTF
jgi:recombinational DNA repair protein RecR